MSSLDLFARGKLSQLEARGLRRGLVETARRDGATVERGGRTLVSFACNDYLGLSHHPQVLAAAHAALARHGAGSAASRLVTGDTPETRRLEVELARERGYEAALVFGSGYLANLGVAPALVGSGDLVLLDARSHSCLWAGARLSGAQVEAFAHNDLADLEARLAHGRPQAGRALVMTESVFSMDGDLASLLGITALAERWDAWTLVDHAHGLGVAEPGARAQVETGSLSKALGGSGGYVCASRAVVDLLTSRARSFVYTTGLAPAASASALAALEVMRAEEGRRAAPLRLARRFTDGLGLPPAESAIVPVIVGDPDAAMTLSAALEREGFLAVAIRPPTVPAGAARLRFTFSAAHTEAQVDGVVEALLRLRGRAAA